MRLRATEFYIDYAGGRIYLADDPTNRKVEATVAVIRVRKHAPDVLISNLTVEKYGSPRKEARSTLERAPDGRSRIARCG